VEHGRRVSNKTVRATAENVIVKKNIGYVRDVVTHEKRLSENKRTAGNVTTCM
jgi:hypothetical protein